MHAPALTRRGFTLAAGACLAGFPLAGSARESARIREARSLMGTRVEIAVQGAHESALRVACDAAFARMAVLESEMSHYSATSRVAAIGLMSGLQPAQVSRELMQVLRMAQGMSRRSDGAFDATVGSLGRWDFDPREPRRPSDAYITGHLPVVGWRHLALDERAGTAFLQQRGMRLDLGGIAKLYILQQGLATLRGHDVATALVDGGGDVVAMSAPGATPWRVGIRDPRAPERLVATLQVKQGFVASSGDYERFFVQDGRRWHHVLDPKTGYPSNGLHGATLVSEELEAVNGLGTAAMVVGMARGRELLRQSGVTQALLASAGGELWISPALRERLS